MAEPGLLESIFNPCSRSDCFVMKQETVVKGGDVAGEKKKPHTTKWQPPSHRPPPPLPVPTHKRRGKHVKSLLGPLLHSQATKATTLNGIRKRESNNHGVEELRNKSWCKKPVKMGGKLRPISALKRVSRTLFHVRVVAPPPRIGPSFQAPEKPFGAH